MSGLLSLFQWERFITPSIIKVFYSLVVVVVLLFGGFGIYTAARVLMLNPINGAFVILANLVGMLVSIMFARIVSEFVLIMFRINEHLGAIRNRGGM
jgi:hypothetical protein